VHPPVTEFSVATFNAHWGLDRRGHPFDVVAAGRRVDADVLVLQEVWRRPGLPATVDGLATALDAEQHELTLAPDTMRARPPTVLSDPDRPGTWGLAVLSRLPVRRRFEIDLGHALGDAVARRIALCIEVDVGGRPLVVAGVHASHKLWGSLPQLRRLDAGLASLDPPTVIAGDLNMWGPVVATVLPGHRRAVRGRTWPAHRPHSQIDHVFVSEGVEVMSGDVLGPLGSDHHAVRARLRLR
jgi:endonuclease/exonuclease/phosphatase family metal-dependent hydrolase